MEKQTKNIITREWVAKELHFYNTADIRATLVLCGILSLFFVPLSVALVYEIVTLFKNALLKIFISIFVGGSMSAPVWTNLLALHTSLKERKMLLKNEFEIAIRTVLYKSEKIVHRHIAEYLHFEDFKEISVEHTTFQLSSQGDDFYIVHYKGSKLIKLLYSSKIYEYKEC